VGLNIDDRGNLYIHQGDTGDVVVTGIDTDKNYKIYFGIKDARRVTVGEELIVESNFQPTVTIRLESEYTDLFNVPVDEPFSVYYYGLKKCADNDVDTLFLENCTYGRLYKFVVFPKLVEGESNE
jgi:hypothetical protein